MFDVNTTTRNYTDWQELTVVCGCLNIWESPAGFKIWVSIIESVSNQLDWKQSTCESLQSSVIQNSKATCHPHLRCIVGTTATTTAAVSIHNQIIQRVVKTLILGDLSPPTANQAAASYPASIKHSTATKAASLDKTQPRRSTFAMKSIMSFWSKWGKPIGQLLWMNSRSNCNLDSFMYLPINVSCTLLFIFHRHILALSSK